MSNATNISYLNSRAAPGRRVVTDRPPVARTLSAVPVEDIRGYPYPKTRRLSPFTDYKLPPANRSHDHSDSRRKGIVDLWRDTGARGTSVHRGYSRLSTSARYYPARPPQNIRRHRGIFRRSQTPTVDAVQSSNQTSSQIYSLPHVPVATGRRHRHEYEVSNPRRHRTTDDARRTRRIEMPTPASFDKSDIALYPQHYQRGRSARTAIRTTRVNQDIRRPGVANPQITSKMMSEVSDYFEVVGRHYNINSISASFMTTETHGTIFLYQFDSVALTALRLRQGKLVLEGFESRVNNEFSETCRIRVDDGRTHRVVVTSKRHISRLYVDCVECFQVPFSVIDTRSKTFRPRLFIGGRGHMTSYVPIYLLPEDRRVPLFEGHLGYVMFNNILVADDSSYPEHERATIRKHVMCSTPKQSYYDRPRNSD